MTAILKSKWMTAEFVQEDISVALPKRPHFNIFSRSTSPSYPKVKLGLVEFCYEWKHWVFVPVAERQFSDRCLLDLAEFLKQLNKK